MAETSPEPHGRAFVVEDEAAQRRLITGILTREGLAVEAFATAEDALAALAAAPADTPPVDVIVSDWRMPGIGGGGLLDALRERGHRPAFVVMTAYGSITHAVEALRRGADDYLTKPFEREALLLTVRRVLKTRRLEQENQRLRDAVVFQDRLGEIIGATEAMQGLYKTVRKLAATEATVLIVGESGTGKELVARTLHRESSRAAGPFVALNCAAIPETLIESELFGHEKGAFTGASRRRPGVVAQAEGGTLFLDEIPSMPLPLQGSLLRVLQERRYTPLGGEGEVACDVRVVAASNRDLLKMVREGSFREDLYYRLNVVPVRVPPLRQRQEDIPLLARELAARAARKNGAPPVEIPAPVLARLLSHPWPGNVRELGNVMERLVLLAEGGVARLSDLPEEILEAQAHPDGCPFRLPPTGIQWNEVEASLLRQALDLTSGNRANAARLLGMSYKTFLYRLEKFDLA